MRITVPIGTRPEVIKLAGVIEALRGAGHELRCVATGQHTDPRMAGDLFAELGCRPDASWELSGDEGERVGQLLSLAFAEMATSPPDAVMVLGDTYTAPLVAFAARRYGVGVIHLEAGLRSFNGRSMEETHRKMMSSLATIHLPPTELAAAFLMADGVPGERMRVVGNPVIDAIVRTGVARLPVADRRGVLLTAHRATNVDDRERLEELVRMACELGTHAGPVTFPLHPRTRARLKAARLLRTLSRASGVHLVPPMPYHNLLEALAASRIVVTDSGGLQEEASHFGVPVAVLRASTPRWETVVTGSTVLTGLDTGRVLDAVRSLADPDELERLAALPCPYGDGRTAERVVEALRDPEILRLLPPSEPELLVRLPEAV